jgi:hypothetical protein
VQHEGNGQGQDDAGVHQKVDGEDRICVQRDELFHVLPRYWREMVSVFLTL